MTVTCYFSYTYWYTYLTFNKYFCFLFQALVGQHYGNRPLPSSIQDMDFHLIRNALRQHRNRDTRDAGLLDRWYQRDTNVVPPVFRLQTPKLGELKSEPENNIVSYSQGVCMASIAKNMKPFLNSITMKHCNLYTHLQNTINKGKENRQQIS